MRIKPFLFTIILFSLLSNVSSFCNDSDNGKNFSIKGNCKSDFGYLGTDYCKEGNIIHEYYCSDNDNCWFYDNYCPFGCKDGKCLLAKQNTNSNMPVKCFDSDNGRDVNVAGVCTDEFGSHFDTCYSDLSLYEWYCKDNKCAVNMNRDFCPGPIPEYKCDWKIPAKCSGKVFEVPSDLLCSETDAGIDVNQRGYAEGLFTDKNIKGKVFGYNANKCSLGENTEKKVSEIYDCCVDSKSSNKLIESYCDNNHVVQTITYNCLNGCNDGKCLKSGVNFNICPEGTSLKEDVLNSVIDNYNGFKCCKDDQCLINGICVESGHFDESEWKACEQGKWIKIHEECYDTDYGFNKGKKGAAFSSDGNNTYDCCKSTNDKNGLCVNDGPYLFEAFCDSGKANLKGIQCENGCSNGVCKKTSNTDIPIIDKNVPCYDSDLNSEFPEGKNWYIKGTITYLNEHTHYKLLSYNDTCVYDRPDYNLVEGICVKGNDGMYEEQTRFNCPHGCKDGACISLPEHLSDYTNVKVSDEQLNELGCCMNPNTYPCDFVPASNCCPNSDNAYVSTGEFTYTSKAAPRNPAECVYEFFYSWPDNTACMRMPKKELDLCTPGCCCEREESGNGEHITPQIIDKIDCRGEDKFWININKDALFNSCNPQTCSEKFASGDFEKVGEGIIRPKVEESEKGIYNRMLIKKAIKEECHPGDCQENLFCLKDYDHPDKMICCPKSTCAVQRECLNSGFEIKRSGKYYICENSIWNAEEVPKINKKKKIPGCSFMPYGNNTPPDFGFFVLLFFLFSRFFVNKLRDSFLNDSSNFV